MGNTSNHQRNHRADTFGLPLPQQWPVSGPESSSLAPSAPQLSHPAVLAAQALRTLAPPQQPPQRQQPPPPPPPPEVGPLVTRATGAEEGVEEVAPAVAEPWGHVTDVMGRRLNHLVLLLENSHTGAMPFPRGSDPQKDLRWLFVGFSPAPAPQQRVDCENHVQLALCKHTSCDCVSEVRGLRGCTASVWHSARDASACT